MIPDYAEILRLYRKFRARSDEPLWVTFVLLGQEMERMKPEDLSQDDLDRMTINEIADAVERQPRYPDPRGPFFNRNKTRLTID